MYMISFLSPTPYLHIHTSWSLQKCHVCDLIKHDEASELFTAHDEKIKLSHCLWLKCPECNCYLKNHQPQYIFQSASPPYPKKKPHKQTESNIFLRP